MTTTSSSDLALEPPLPLRPVLDPARLERTSARCGLGYAAGQLVMTVVFGVLVLPAAGPPDAGPLEKGKALLEHADLFTVGNYLLVLPSLLLVGFLGVVAARLRGADPSGTLAAVALAAGTLVALLWPLGAVLHDLALDTATAGVDVRVAAAWDAVGPYTLALSALFRTAFVVAVTVGLVGACSLRRSGWAVAALSLLGSATLIADGAFAVLAVSTLAFDGWVAAVAWRWSRAPR
jgi:hypothetical protein